MLFFERQKTIRGEWPNIYQRDIFPIEVRTQCWQLVDLDGDECKRIVVMLRHTLGKFELNDECYGHNPYSRELLHFFMNGLKDASGQSNIEYAFSVLELMVQCKQYIGDGTISAINYRLRLGGIGYKIIDREIVPVDDDDIATSSTIPVISLLNRPEFSDADKYLRQAFLDYREGSEKSLENAIDNAAKAGECLLKHIFDKTGIKYGEKDTYMPLIQRAKENGLFPAVDDDKLAPLANALKCLGSIRNRGGGHGAPDKKATDRLVRLALNHAASNILYIAETYLEEYKK